MRKNSLSSTGPWSAYRLTAAIMGFTLLLQQPLCAQVVSSVEQATVIADLTKLPGANQKIVTAVYPFRMSTDQSSQLTNQTPQTAAVDTYTTILFEVLRTSGWFIPVEHGNAGDLLNGQRDKPSASSTTIESSSLSASQKPTIILEAGLLSHDEHTRSDEAGNLYFANSISNRYRQDRATVFLRVLSAQSGKILKTIYWTRTVLSQPAGANTYRYVLVDQPNAIPNGVASISPDQVAIAEAVKQAVRGLIIEGIRDGLWVSSNLSAVQIQNVIAAYEAERINSSSVEKSSSQSRGVRSIYRQIDPSFVNLYLYSGLIRYHGDYTNWNTKAAYGLSVEVYATPRIGVQLNAATGTLASQNAFSTNLTSVDMNLMVRVLPYFRLTPLVYGGVGVVSRSTENPFAIRGTKYFQYQGGVGLQYSLNNIIGFRAVLSYNQPKTDRLDGKRAGSHNDFYVRSTLGLLIHFGRYMSGSNQVTRQEYIRH